MSKDKTIVSAVKCESYDPELLQKSVRAAVEAVGGWPKSVCKGSSVLLKPICLLPVS